MKQEEPNVKRVARIKKGWLMIFVAALFEVFWVIGLKHASDIWTWLGTAVAIFVSFTLMILAGRLLPVGTVYAVFVGLGTAGTMLAEIILFAEPVKMVKILLVLVLLTGVIGLKLVTKTEEPETKGVQG